MSGVSQRWEIEEDNSLDIREKKCNDVFFPLANDL